MNDHNRELRVLAFLCGTIVLWAAVSFWYHRLWLEALTERTNDLATTILYLGRHPPGAGTAPDHRAATTLEQEEITVSWPAKIIKETQDGGAGADGT